MRKHILIISCITILSTIINVSALNTVTRVTDITLEQTTEQSQIKYILKDYNGQIALFISNEEKPMKIYNIFTSSLPTKDAALIKSGVLVTENELIKILEEFTS